MIRNKVALVALAAVPLALLAVFFGYPVVALIGRGLVGDNGPQLTVFADVLTTPRIQRLIGFTVWQAGLSAFLCVLLGIPGAYVLYRCRFPGRSVLRAFVTVPFVLPTVVVGLAFRTVLAPSGPLGSWGLDGTLVAILAAHVFLNYSVVVRTVGASWALLDPRPAEAARSLGAGPLRVLWTVTLPALGPAIAGAMAMVFLFCATSFGIMLVMGGGQYRTLETEIYRQTVDVLDLSTAAVLSITQLVLVTAVLLLAGFLRRRAERALKVAAAPVRIGLGAAPAVAVTALMVVVMVVPIAVLAIRSLRTPTGWGWDNYRSLAELGSDNMFLVPVTAALANSLRAAAIAALLAVGVGVALSVVLSRRPRNPLARKLIGGLDAVMMLPLGVSAVTVGFGFLIALDTPPLDLRASPLLVPIAQALVTLPLVVRMVLPVLRSVDQRLRQAASMLGASGLRVWTGVDLPVMSRALAGATAFAFAVAMGEFGATSFLAGPQNPTLPVVIARLIGRPGTQNTGTALAAATVLAAVCAAAVFLVEAAFRVASRGLSQSATAAARPGGNGKPVAWGGF